MRMLYPAGNGVFRTRSADDWVSGKEASAVTLGVLEVHLILYSEEKTVLEWGRGVKGGGNQHTNLPVNNRTLQSPILQHIFHIHTQVCEDFQREMAERFSGLLDFLAEIGG